MEAKELGEIEPVAKTEARVASVFHIEVLTLRRWEDAATPASSNRGSPSA